VQNSGRTWMAGSKWNDKSVIRISVCSWMTSENDIKEVLSLFENAIKSH